MAMRLADTISSIDVLALPFSFRGRLRTGVCPVFLITQLSPHCPKERAYGTRTNVCKNCVCQTWVRALAVKWPCDASRARAADDSIGGPQMLKFLNALAALAAVGTFVIAFFDSYEVRFKVRRRSRGADGRRHLRRNKRK